MLERVRATVLKLQPMLLYAEGGNLFEPHDGGEVISTLKDMVQAVTDWPTPTNQKQLKSFLGLASYYRRFIQGFSCLAVPLFRLLQKDRDFVRTEQCEEALISLQRALCVAPVLGPTIHLCLSAWTQTLVAGWDVYSHKRGQGVNTL